MTIKSIKIRPDFAVIEVCWDNDGVEHRRAFSAAERADFLAAVPDGLPYAAECWPNWKAEDYLPVPPTNEQIISGLVAALESHYDATAQARRYDNRLTCALRAGYAGPFQAEGQAFAIWMDVCNAYGYQVMADCLAGNRAIPTPPELIAELPELVWPS